MKRYLLIIWLALVGLLIVFGSCASSKSKTASSYDSTTVKVSTVDSSGKKDSVKVVKEEIKIKTSTDSTVTKGKTEVEEETEETHFDTSGKKTKVIVTKKKTKTENATYKKGADAEYTQTKTDSTHKTEAVNVQKTAKDSTTVKSKQSSKEKESKGIWWSWLLLIIPVGAYFLLRKYF